MRISKGLMFIKQFFRVMPDKVALLKSKLIQFRSVLRDIIFRRSRVIGQDKTTTNRSGLNSFPSLVIIILWTTFMHFLIININRQKYYRIIFLLPLLILHRTSPIKRTFLTKKLMFFIWTCQFAVKEIFEFSETNWLLDGL